MSDHKDDQKSTQPTHEQVLAAEAEAAARRAAVRTAVNGGKGANHHIRHISDIANARSGVWVAQQEAEKQKQEQQEQGPGGGQSL